MKLDDWLFSDASPRDFYELIGVNRFDPDREVVLRNLRDVVRRLMQYERHEKAEVARRATRLQRDTAMADRTLRSHELLRQSHAQILERLSQEWAVARSSGAELAAWLQANQVHPERISLVAKALEAGEFDLIADAMDWVDIAEPVQDTLADSGEFDSKDKNTTAAGSASSQDEYSLAPLEATARPAAPSSARLEPNSLPSDVKKPATAGKKSPSLPPRPPPAKLPTALVTDESNRLKKYRAAIAAAAFVVVAGGIGLALWSLRQASPAPMLVVVSDLAVDEEQPLEHVFDVIDVDSEIEPDDLELAGAVPAGLRFFPAERRLVWTPTEQDGPGEYLLVLRLRRTRHQLPDDIAPFKITVREVNRAPQIREATALQGPQGETLNGRLNVFDPDVPANAVRLELIAPDSSVTLDDPSPGSIKVTTEDAKVGSRQVRIRVLDEGNPPASTETTVSVTVTTPPVVAATIPRPIATPTSPTARQVAAAPAAAPFAPDSPSSDVPAGMPAPTTNSSPPQYVELRPSPSLPPIPSAVNIYECGFDKEVPEFPAREGSAIIDYADGRLNVEIASDDGRPAGDTVGRLALDASPNFACELRVRFVKRQNTLELSDETKFIDFGFNLDGPKNCFWLDGSRQRFHLGRSAVSSPLPPNAFRENGDNTMFLVVASGRMYALLNGVRLGIPTQLDQSTTLPLQPEIVVNGSSGTRCEVDHLTVWRLDKPEFFAMPPGMPGMPGMAGMPGMPPGMPGPFPGMPGMPGMPPGMPGAMPGGAPTAAPPSAPFVADYDAVDLPPLAKSDAATPLMTDYFKPDAVAQLRFDLATADGLGPTGLSYRLEQQQTNGENVCRWNVTAVNDKTTDGGAAADALPVAQFTLTAAGVLEFRWMTDDAVHEHLRNSVLFAEPLKLRRPLLLRRFVRMSPLAVDTEKGVFSVPIGTAAGLTRLDGLHVELLGLDNFPVEARPQHADVGGSKRITVSYFPGLVRIDWVLSLVKLKGDLHFNCSMQAIDDGKIAVLTALKVRNESKGLEQQESATSRKLDVLKLARERVEARRPFLSTQEEVDAFNAAVIKHNRQVEETQNALDNLKKRKEIYEQVIAAIDGIAGKGKIRFRVYFTVKDKQFEIARAY